MDSESKIKIYLCDEIRNEYYEYRKYDIDPTARLIYLRLKEFYWTVTRLIGLGYLHDGTRVKHAVVPPYMNDGSVSGDVVRAMAAPRVLIDVTATHRSGRGTGIQRVVREIAKKAFEAGTGLPVYIKGGQLLPYFKHPALPEKIDLTDGDKFVMIDATWGLTEEYESLMQRVMEKNGENIVGLHDLIPFLYPDSVSREAYSSFTHWFETIVMRSDAVVCVSKWTAMTLKDYITEHRCPVKSDFRIGWWRLGADFEPMSTLPPSPEALAITQNGTPFFLSVGTLEPRKSYSIALSAFDRLWNENTNVRYVIVGRRGWQCRFLEHRIKSHKEFGRRLVWLDNANDSDLRYLYEHARALIFPSVAEGFGLPLVEACCYGLPVITSDLPNFREICGDAATYFELLNSEALANKISDALSQPKPTTMTPIYSWQESAAALLEIVRRGHYQIDAETLLKSPM